MKLCGVISTEIDNNWDDVKGFISDAIKYSHDRYTIDSVYKCVSEKSMQLWKLTEDNKIVGAGTSYITNYPNKTVCTIAFYGGKMPYETISTMENWARESGCDEIEIVGRKGWLRQMKEYKLIHTTIGKEL